MEVEKNQRVVTTMKAECNEKNVYSPVNIKAMRDAMNVLKASTFKIWMYLGKNQNDYTFALSKVDVMSFCHISRSTYLAGINELIEQRYLILREPGSNHYDFYEVPPPEILVTTHKAE